jgi:HlyD family secretion protein
MMDLLLFRPQALDSLREPEQVGRALQLVRAPYRWLFGLAALAALGAVAASIVIRVPITTRASGVILHESATLERTVAAQQEGLVAAVRVKQGDSVAAGDVIATVSQPALENDLRLARDENAAATRRQADVRRLQQTSMDTLEPLHEHLEREAEESITRLERRRDELEQFAGDNARLRATGNTTVDRYLQIRQQLAETIDGIAAKRAALLNLQVEWAEKTNAFAREATDVAERVAQTGRQVERLETQLDRASTIHSTQAGIVAEVKLNAGDLVRFNTPVIGLLPSADGDADRLVAVAFVPLAEGKKVTAGDPAFVEPSSIRRDVYGQVRGQVTTVSDTPATPELLRSMVRNDELARRLTEGGVAFIATIEMERNATTPSGYAWTSSTGPDKTLSPGTTLRVEIETDRVRLISLLLPALRQLLRAEPMH